MKKTFLSIALLAIAVCGVPCKGSAQKKSSTPQKVIIDMDLGSSTDDVVALDLLFKYQDLGKVKVLGIVCDRPGFQHAVTADILRCFYGYPDTPIALEYEGTARKFIDYSPVLGSNNKSNLQNRNNDVPDGYQLYRQQLAEAEDSSVVIVSCGFVTSIARLLESGSDGYSPMSGVDLVSKKVRQLIIMGGQFERMAGADSSDYNMKTAPSFARTFLENWPQKVPIVYNIQEVGNAVDYPPYVVRQDLENSFDSNTLKNHPLYQIYSICKIDKGQRMWDALNVLYLVEGKEYFEESNPGWVDFDDDFVMKFREDSLGKHSYIKKITDKDGIRKVVDRIRQLVKQKPGAMDKK